jgi:CheY-like chemotaxis protein
MTEKPNLIPQISKSLKPLNLLLAEDDTINQKVIMKMLNEKGHKVEVANNGYEALQQFEIGKYDAILMDIQMPKMDGVEASQRIRQKDDENNHTPIIALTAYALQGDRERFLALGMDGYVSKPIQMEELFSTLERLTEHHGTYGEYTPSKVILTESGEIHFASERLKPNTMMIPTLNEISDNLNVINSAMENNDLMVIENLAHEIKVLSNEIDASEMKDIAFKIEIAARRGNLEEITKFIEMIKTELKIYRESIVS